MKKYESLAPEEEGLKALKLVLKKLRSTGSDGEIGYILEKIDALETEIEYHKDLIDDASRG